MCQAVGSASHPEPHYRCCPDTEKVRTSALDRETSGPSATVTQAGKGGGMTDMTQASPHPHPQENCWDEE